MMSPWSDLKSLASNRILRSNQMFEPEQFADERKLRVPAKVN